MKYSLYSFASEGVVGKWIYHLTRPTEEKAERMKSIRQSRGGAEWAIVAHTGDAEAYLDELPDESGTHHIVKTEGEWRLLSPSGEVLETASKKKTIQSEYAPEGTTRGTKGIEDTFESAYHFER